MSRTVLTLGLAGLFCGLPLPAAAGLDICNRTAHVAAVALGAFDGTAWGSRGWWTVPSGACVEIVAGPLIARYYYLYAVHGAGGAWSGNRSFCVGTGQFEITGRDACVERGYDRKRFFQVDTGNASDWTETLAD